MQYMYEIDDDHIYLLDEIERLHDKLKDEDFYDNWIAGYGTDGSDANIMFYTIGYHKYLYVEKDNAYRGFRLYDLDEQEEVEEAVDEFLEEIRMKNDIVRNRAIEVFMKFVDKE